MSNTLKLPYMAVQLANDYVAAQNEWFTVTHIGYDKGSGLWALVNSERNAFIEVDMYRFDGQADATVEQCVWLNPTNAAKENGYKLQAIEPITLGVGKPLRVEFVRNTLSEALKLSVKIGASFEILQDGDKLTVVEKISSTVAIYNHSISRSPELFSCMYEDAKNPELLPAINKILGWLKVLA